MHAADVRLVADIVEWPFGEVLLDVRLKPADHLAVCGRADGWDVVVNGMVRRTFWKPVRYACELVVPEPLNAVRRHPPFYDSHWKFLAPKLVSVGAGSS